MKKTLFIIVPGFPSTEADTTCLPPIQNFVKGLNSIFPELTVIIFTLQYPYRKDSYQWFGNTVHSFNGKFIPKITKPLFWLTVYTALSKQSKQASVIGVLSFWCGEAALVGKFFSKRKKINHFIWMQGQDARLKNPYISLVRPKPEELIAISESMAIEMVKNYGLTPAHTITNGVDPKQGTPLPGNDRPIDLLAVGSLIPLKQYNVFIQLVANLKKDFPHMSAVLVGAGPEHKILLQLIHSLNLHDNIIMTGELSHDEVLKKMTQSKMLIHPSLYEGYSTVCLEALHAGCHVLSFVRPGTAEIKHWHVVNDMDEMNSVSSHLLKNENDFTSVLVNSMEDSARNMMRLFNYPSQ